MREKEFENQQPFQINTFQCERSDSFARRVRAR